MLFSIMSRRDQPGDDPEQACSQLEPFAEAGLTWWMGGYEIVVGRGRRDPLQRVRAHDVPMGGWGWCNEARHGRPLDASPPALRSPCLLANNFFIHPVDGKYWSIVW